MIVYIEEGNQLGRRILHWSFILAFMLSLVGTYLLVIAEVGTSQIYVGVLILILTALGVGVTPGKRKFEDSGVPGKWPVEYVIMNEDSAKKFLSDPVQKENARLESIINSLRVTEFVGTMAEVSESRKKRREYEDTQQEVIKELILLYREEFGIEVDSAPWVEIHGSEVVELLW